MTEEKTEKFKIPLQRIPQAPPTLDAILDTFSQDHAGMEDGKEVLKKIKEFEENFNNGADADDVRLDAKVGMESYLSKVEYQKAFIEYMGLTLYWHKKKKFDIAWYYYAKAQYYLGIHNSWDHARDYITKKELDGEHKAKGGRAKNAELREHLRAALAKVIVEKKPSEGWKSKIQLFDAAIPTFTDVCEELKVDSEFIHEEFHATVFSWLRTSGELALLFNDHKYYKPIKKIK